MKGKAFNLTTLVIIFLLSNSITVFGQTCEHCGIGEQAPTAKLEIEGCGSTNSSNALLITDSADKVLLTVTDSGYVGIGTTNPLNVLHVNGDARIDSVKLDTSAVKVMLLDSNGVVRYKNLADLTKNMSNSDLTLEDYRIHDINGYYQLVRNNGTNMFMLNSNGSHYISHSDGTKYINMFKQSGYYKVKFSADNFVINGNSSMTYTGSGSFGGGKVELNHSGNNGQLVAKNSANSTSVSLNASSSAASYVCATHADQFFGIGTNSPSYKLEVTDTAGKPGDAYWTVTSDIRVKKDVSNYGEGLSKLRQVKPIRFKYNGLGGTPTHNHEYIGVSAQDMKKILPSCVGIKKVQFLDTKLAQFPGDNVKGLGKVKVFNEQTQKEEEHDCYSGEILDYNPNELFYTMVNSIKELDTQNQQLQKQIDVLKKELEAIKNK